VTPVPLAARIRARLDRELAELRRAYAGRLEDWTALPWPDEYARGSADPVVGDPGALQRWWAEVEAELEAGNEVLRARVRRAIVTLGEAWERRRILLERRRILLEGRLPPLPPLDPEDPADVERALRAVAGATAFPSLWHPFVPLPLTAGDALDLVEAEADNMAAELAEGIAYFARELVAPELPVDAVLAREDLADRWPWPEPWPKRPGGPASINPGWSALDSLLDPVHQERAAERSAERGHTGPRQAEAGDMRRNWMPGEVAPLKVAKWARDALNRLEPGRGDAAAEDAEAGRMVLRALLVGPDGAVLPAGGLALLFLAEQEVERDRRRPAMAVDANPEHHALLTGWGELARGMRGTSGRQRLRPQLSDERAEITLFAPGRPAQLRLPLDGASPSEEVIRAIKSIARAEGVRSWAALLRLLSIEGGRAGWVRWTVDAHLEALGYTPSERRRLRTRDRMARMVETFTELELAVTVGGRERERRPLMLVGGRFERLQGSRWRLDGMELQINPLLYRGVRDLETGKLGRNWYPTVPEVAKLDHIRYAPALMLGLLLPIRWRWDVGERDHLPLRGDNLLDLAGIVYRQHKPGEAWNKLERNLDKLVEIDALGRWTADDGGRKPEAVYRLYPPGWTVDRTVHGVVPVERRLAALPRTGTELRAWREARDWTQAKLARALGVSRRTVVRAEGGGDAPLTPAVLRGLGQAM